MAEIDAAFPRLALHGEHLVSTPVKGIRAVPDTDAPQASRPPVEP